MNKEIKMEIYILNTQVSRFTRL